jgi:accessory colonization factor AcfC
MDKKIADTISTDQFKAFLLEQIKRIVKKGYKAHLRSLDDLQQKQLKIIYENKDVIAAEILQNLILLDNVGFNNKRKEILDIGNNITREIENLFENLVININNKEDL